MHGAELVAVRVAHVGEMQNPRGTRARAGRLFDGRAPVGDGDVVELSNLNRQILHNDARIGINKAVSAEMTLRVRLPWWLAGDAEIYVNDQKQSIASKPSSFVSLKRTWVFSCPAIAMRISGRSL